jgi:hypothetical protein
MSDSTFDPQWMEADYLAQKSLTDDLGMEAEGRFNLIPRLTPGFTGQTSRARYYSFWTWAIDEFRRDTSIKHNSRTFTEHLRRFENAVLLAYLAHGCNSGAVGVTQASQVWNGGTETEYDIAGWKSLSSQSRGAYSQSYSGPLQAMNLTEWAGSYVTPTKPTGIDLAEAFRRSIQDSDYYRQFRHAQSLPHDLIADDMAQHLCLCRLKDFPEERQALMNAFFRFDTPDVYCVQRLKTLCFFLDVIDQSKGARLTAGDFRRLIYFRVYEDGHIYRPEGNLMEPADQWRVLQMQQYYRYGIESLWSLLLSGIYHDWKSLEEYLHWFWEGFDMDALAEQFGLALARSDHECMKLTEFVQSVCAALPDNYVDLGPDSKRSTLNENLLYQELRTTRKRPTRQIQGGYSILILSLAYLRFRHWCDEKTNAWQLARYQRMNEPDRYNRDRLPPASFVDDMDRMLTADWTLADSVAWLHQRYLVLQHKRVALRRLREENEDLAHVEYDDVTRRLYGRHRYTPSLNGLPWYAALGLLQDLGVVLAVGNRTYELVEPDGRMLLNRFRTHVVPDRPRWIEDK